MTTNSPDTAQDPATETPFFSEKLMDILELLPTLPRHEREEVLHHVTCSLAEFNRMYAQAFSSTTTIRQALSPRCARTASSLRSIASSVKTRRGNAPPAW